MGVEGCPRRAKLDLSPVPLRGEFAEAGGNDAGGGARLRSVLRAPRFERTAAPGPRDTREEGDEERESRWGGG